MKILDFFHEGYHMKNCFVNEPPGKFGQNQWKLGVRVTPRFHHAGGLLIVFENTVSLWHLAPYTVRSKKKMTTFWSIVYFWEMIRFRWNFWCISALITSFFFTNIFTFIGHVLRKLRAKMHFFNFSKMSKNTYMTRKIHPPNYWHYGFSSYFGFGSKHSIAIFSAIQNVIWSRIDDFRIFWNLHDFPLFTCF